MTIAKDFATKASVAFVAIAMLFTMFAPAAQAQSSADLQAQIEALLAQIASLQGSTGGSSSAAGVCPYTWTRDLNVGAQGADVKVLQQFLNANADTRVAASGVGSAGMETEFYGPATAAAVSKFQVTYRADILTPAGLVNPTGYFGPGTRAKANSVCVAAPVVDGGDTDTDGDDDTDGDSDNDNEDRELSGEASLSTFEVEDPSETEVQEGEEDVEIAELRVEFEDGDAMISRLDVALVGPDNGGVSEPWETFESLSLWVDGEKVAEVAADDEDRYLGNEEDGVLRFTGLEIYGWEDEEFEVLVGATLQSGLDAENIGDWDVTVEGIRFFDGEGESTDIDGSDADADGIGSDIATVEVEEEGEGEELKFRLASSNPDATDIVVDEDTRTNDVTILEYTIEAEEGDIDLETLFVNVQTFAADYEDVVADIELMIDGQRFTDEATLMTGAYSASSTRVEFDIDNDITIADGEEVTVKVVVDFLAQDGNYANGDRIMARVSTAERQATDAEGNDNVTEFTGTAVGEEHTLVAEGIVVPVDGVTTEVDTQGDNDQTGILTIEFEVTAIEETFYLAEAVSGNTGVATTGVAYRLEGPAGFVATSSGVLASTADEDEPGVFTLNDGETETFTLTVTADVDTTGQYRIVLTEINYTLDDTGVTNTESYIPTPEQDFRTQYININAN